MKLVLLLAALLMLSGCASRCDEWCRITIATKDVLR